MIKSNDDIYIVDFQGDKFNGRSNSFYGEKYKDPYKTLLNNILYIMYYMEKDIIDIPLTDKLPTDDIDDYGIFRDTAVQIIDGKIKTTKELYHFLYK